MATVDVIANRSTASEILGKAYFETDTNSFIVYNGSGWVELQSDGTGAAAPFSQYSVDFDGTNGYMDVGSVTQINSVTNLSTSSWFKIDTYQDGPIILGGHSASPGNEFFVQAFNATSLRYGHDGNYGTYLSGSIPTGSWHNVVTVQAGTSLTVYVNGTSVGTATVAAVNSGWGSNFTIGRWSGGGYNYMDGHIDEVALFTSALSSSDVTSIYNDGNGPTDISSLNPVGWWRMGDNDGGTGTTITDQGFDANGNPSGNNGTLTNGPTFSTDVPS